MASSFQHLLLLSSLLLYITSSSVAKTPFHPKALLLRVSKDSSTNQYLTQIKQRTPSVPIKLTVDLGGSSMTTFCAEDYTSSSTYRHVPCNSTVCTRANSATCSACSRDEPNCDSICLQEYNNPINFGGNFGSLDQEILFLESTNGKNPGKAVSVPNFLFDCVGWPSFLDGLANGVQGIAGLGIHNISIPYQLSNTLGLQKKFAICLSPSPQSDGVIFLGQEQYQFLPGFDVSNHLSYTPLLTNSSGSSSYFGSLPATEYFIGVKSIKVNSKRVKINKQLLALGEYGGGTMLSTVKPYTVLESSIYKAVTEAFVKAMKKVPRVKAVAPFGVCFSAKHIGETTVGPAVPPIDLVLQNNGTVWRIWGANSMVQVNEKTLCLGIVDGGNQEKASIVIGGHQLENNFLEFDFGAKKVGFSGSLLGRGTTCFNFNFSSAL